MKPKLKLFVWEDVLRDYNPGIMFALAENEDQARKLLVEKILAERGPFLSVEDLFKQPEVVEESKAFYVTGGG